MNYKKKLTIFSLLLMMAGLIAAQQEKKAIAILNGQDVFGNISFVQTYGNWTVSPVKISGYIQGLTHGDHGFHIHEKGDLSNGCASTGAHFNPHRKKHGAPHVTERHVGDLGNVEADADGKAIVDINDAVITLYGPHSIIGRAVVVHADPDDLGAGGFSDSLSTGHAGGRVACGIIGVL